VGKIITTFLIFLFLAVSAYADEKLVAENVKGYFGAEITTDEKGDIWIAYYDMSRRIIVKNLNIGKELIFKDEAEQSSRGFGFTVQGEHIYVVWREKISGTNKKLYLRASHDGGKTLSDPVLLDDSTTEALARIKVGANSKGDVYVTWLSEKRTETSDYSIYAVASNDFGKTFTKPYNITSGYAHSIYPTLLVDENNAYSFSYSEKNKKNYMIFTKTTDRGKTWTEPVEIKEIGVVTLFIEPIKIDKRLHVFWFNSYGEGIPIIEGAYSDDEGKTWKTIAFDETKGFDVGSLKVSYNSQGNIYLAFGGKWDEKEKSKVYLLASNDNGTTWGKIVSIRHYPYDLTTAMNPVVKAAENGEVVVVWEDYRNIRSNLYMQYSKDGGKTWQEKDIPLEEPGRFNTALWHMNNSIIKIKEKYYVLSPRSIDDKVGKEKLILFDFIPGGSK
jgi:hypothetical protein